jgi:hypothetical protein
VFHSKSKSSIDSHMEINLEMFSEWFLNKFLLYLRPESVIVMGSASYHSIVLDKVLTIQKRKNEKCSMALL